MSFNRGIFRKVVIFASSIGRSGTRYLANLFAHCTDVPAWHAVEPLCHDQIMIDVNNGLQRVEVIEKARNIQAIVAQRGAYFEATQIFTRVLAETFLEVFPEVSVIQLLRDPMAVASSYVNRKSYPSHADRPWRMALNQKRALFKFPQKLTPFQENLCDWLENEMRYQELKPQFAKTANFSFANFESPERICELFERLDVPYRESDVVYHTTKRDLDQNANPRKTRITRRYITQSKKLLSLLRDHEFPGSLFRLDCYQEFEFTRRIAEL